MTLSKQPVLRVVSLVLMLLLLINILPLQSLAAKDVIEEEIELTGKYNGIFSLDSSTMELFRLENVVPGDSWEGKFHVRNTTKDKMEFAILSIVSNLKDHTLYNALDLQIYHDGEEIYNGSYGATQEPISRFYTINAGKKITFDFVVSLPKTVGNEVQNKKMDSTWTYEARYYGTGSGGGTANPKPVEYTVYYVDRDGNDLLDRKTGEGLPGKKVIETAPDIEGYTTPVKNKSINLSRFNENKIVFVYSKDKGTTPNQPSEPSTPPDPQDPTTPDNPGDSDNPGGAGSTDPINPNNPNDTDPTTPSDGDSTSGSSGEPTGSGDTGAPGDGSTDDSSKDPSVKTGVDKTDSNSMTVMWLFVFGLCVIGGGVLFVRIRAEKARAAKQNSNARRQD